MEPITKVVDFNNDYFTQFVNIEEYSTILNMTNDEILEKLAINFGCCMKEYFDTKLLHGNYTNDEINKVLFS